MSPPEPGHHAAYDCEPPRTELTSIEQFDSCLSPPSSPAPKGQHTHSDSQQVDALTFPTLESDGSLPDIREASTSSPHFHTPSAPSSFIAAASNMADTRDMESSVESLQTDYDMLDDVSAISTDDGHETASLTSTDHAVSDDEGQMTPEAGDLSDEDDEDHNGMGDEKDRNGDEVQVDFGSFEDIKNLAGTLGSTAAREVESENNTIDSIMSEDLETPRQSVVAAPTAPSSPATLAYAVPNKHDSAPIQLHIAVYPTDGVNLDNWYDGLFLIGDHIALCLGAEGFQQVVQLPATPDDSVGPVLIRYKNLHLTVSVAGTDSVATSESLAAAGTPDLLVFYLAADEVLSHETVERARASLGTKVPTLIFGQPEQAEEVVQMLGSGVCGVQQHALFTHCKLLINKLHLLLDDTLESKGWKRLSVSDGKKKAAEPRLIRFLRKTSPSTFERLWQLMLATLLLTLLMPYIFTNFNMRLQWSTPSLEIQRERLSQALDVWSDSNNIDFNLTASLLLPCPKVSENGPRTKCANINLKQYAICVADEPTFDASNIRVSGLRQTKLPFEITPLAADVYGINILTQQSPENVQIAVPLPRPSGVHEVVYSSSWTAVNPLWEAGTYKKAGQNLSKAINSEVAVVQQAAKSLTDRMAHDLVDRTNELSIRINRDVQLFYDNTFGALGRAAASGHKSVKSTAKDLLVVRKDLILRVDELKKSLATSARGIKDLIVLPTKKSLVEPLARSRARALGLKKALQEKKRAKKGKAVEVEQKACKKGWKKGFLRDRLQRGRGVQTGDEL